MATCFYILVKKEKEEKKRTTGDHIMHGISLNALMKQTYLSYWITYFICIMMIHFRNQTFIYYYINLLY